MVENDPLAYNELLRCTPPMMQRAVSSKPHTLADKAVNVDDYIAELEAGCKRLTAADVVADVRGNPPSIGSFLYASSEHGAVEISIDGDKWFVEFWGADTEYASSESTLPSFSDAIDAARAWLISN